MHYSIHFTTNKFDVSKENENPINPIYGESLLIWIREKLKGRYEIPEPEAEDWGWYTFIVWGERTYMLGSSATRREDGYCDWVLQIDKYRTVKERIFGKEKMNHGDACLAFFESLLEADAEIKSVRIE